MNIKLWLTVILIGVVSGCGSDSGKGKKQRVENLSLSCSAELDTMEQSALKTTEEMFDQFSTASSRIWNARYRLDRTPVLYVRREGNKDGCALLINYQGADQLANTTAVNIPKDISLDNVYRIEKLPEEISKINNFEFQYNLHGKKVFIMKVKTTDFDIARESSKKDWMLYVAHEGMHNYQDSENFKSFDGIQDVENYPLTTESIALILLEQAILNDIAKDVDAGKSFLDISLVVMQLIAVRDLRYQTFSESKVHDLYQEQHEGTAKYIENRLGSLTKNERINLNSYYQKHNEIADEKIRDQLAFMRFYFSGSLISHILDMKKIGNWKQQIEQGKSPYEILSAAIPMSEAEKRSYLSQAKADFSYDKLVIRGDRLAKIAAGEPKNIFK